MLKFWLRLIIIMVHTLNKKNNIMNRITYLFLAYFLACIGYGFGKVYINETYVSSIFAVIGLIIALLTIKSDSYRTKEAHEFYRSQVFWTNLLSLICFMFTNRPKPLIAFHTGIFIAAMISVIFWLSTFPYKRNDDQNNRRMRRSRRNDLPPLAWYNLSGFLNF